MQIYANGLGVPKKFPWIDSDPTTKQDFFTVIGTRDIHIRVTAGWRFGSGGNGKSVPPPSQKRMRVESCE